MRFLQWAKLHAPVRFDLTSSGAASLDLADLGIAAPALEIKANGTYGDPQLMERIARRYGVAAERVVPVCGASLGNFVALALFAGHAERVVIEQPGYDPLWRAGRLLYGAVDRLTRPPRRNFAPCLDELDAMLARGARCIVLTNLHNPSGQRLDAPDLADMARRCRACGAHLVVDEVYLDAAHLNAAAPRWSAASIDGVTVINSLTKIHGLSGLRAGWLVVPEELVERAREVVDLLQVVNPAPSAALTRQVLDHLDVLDARYQAAYRRSRPVLDDWLNHEPTVTSYTDFGVLFALLRLPVGVRARQLDDLLTSEYETQVVPGDFFDLPDHVRISLAADPCDLGEALGRISAALCRLRAAPSAQGVRA